MNSITIEFKQNKTEHYADVEAWSDFVGNAYVNKVLSVFSDHNDLIFEYWPQYGQISIWEPGYEDKKWPLHVYLQVKSWHREQNEILYNSASDEDCERESVLFEHRTLSLIKPFIESMLGTKYNIKYYLTNDNEII